MLLVAFTTEDTPEAIDCILHIWYSAFIRNCHLTILRQKVLPLVQEIALKIANKPPNRLCGKTWKFGKSTLRLQLTGHAWSALLRCLTVPTSHSREEALHIRSTATMAPSRLDYRERAMLSQSPGHRVSDNYFREEGVLLLISHSRAGFIVPNPTFFNGLDWPMMDSADPLEGWNFNEVMKLNHGPATNDVYAKLYAHVKGYLYTFHQRLSSHRTEFKLLHDDATALPGMLPKDTFARIETANIADTGYVGIDRLIRNLAPLLQTPSNNPKAALLTLFMNATHQINAFSFDVAEKERDAMRAASYLGIPTHLNDPTMCSIMAKLVCVRNNAKLFDKYMVMYRFRDIERSYGVVMRANHSIVEKWPTGLKLRPGQPGAQEEFDMLAASSHTGAERFVEWVRTA